jgi:hypothetical protein
MKAICFFNHYHNGDLFNGKEFIKEIISNIPTKYYYAHSNHPIVLSDLNVEHVSSFDISHSVKVLDDGDVIWVNTWIGAYFDKNKPYYGECSLRFLYQMYGEIYQELNKIFDLNLQLSNIINYFPSINYSKFDCKNIDKFVLKNPQRKVLFSNGPGMSAQCTYNGNMSPVIETLANDIPNIIFIATEKFETELKNIKFTNDIIQSNHCDLNEISYLSTFCDLIVGKNSGPFNFAVTRQNLKDTSKTFYAFNNNHTKEFDCLCYGIDIECNFIYEHFTTLELITKSLFEILNK